MVSQHLRVQFCSAHLLPAVSDHVVIPVLLLAAAQVQYQTAGANHLDELLKLVKVQLSVLMSSRYVTGEEWQIALWARSNGGDR